LRQVPEIDLVIGGHEHDPLTATVGGRLIAKAGSDAKWLGVTRFALDGSRAARHELVTITDKTPSDAAMASLIKRYTDQLGKELEIVIGETTVPLDARNSVVRQQESALGNFIADVMRAAVQADLAITNGGGIRTNALFPAGRIARKDAFAWLPFGNVIVKVAVPGAAIRQALRCGKPRCPCARSRGTRRSLAPPTPATLRESSSKRASTPRGASSRTRGASCSTAARTRPGNRSRTSSSITRSRRWWAIRSRTRAWRP
jgi:hypothetical protein